PSPSPSPTPSPKPRIDVCAGKPATPAYLKAQADAAAAAAAAGGGAGAGGRQGGGGGGGRGGAATYNATTYLKESGALGVFSTAPRGHGIYTIGGASRNADPATGLPAITIAAEEY